MQFDEIWIPPEQLNQTCALAQSTSYLEGECVEIGAWQGLSTVSIANAVAPAILHVVDWWRGDSAEAVANGTAIKPELLERDNYGIFRANMDEGTAGNYQVYNADWREWIKGWDKPIRFLHLDADHTTKEVVDNLVAILPFAVPGAIYCGDDYDWPSVRAGVDQVLPGVEKGAGKMWWKVIG